MEHSTEAISVRLVKVVVPAYELHGNFAMLECQYELNNSDNRHSKSSKYHFPYDSNEQSDEGETLYSVKWYKDNEEFYRYLPKANPPQHSYRVDGIKVDVSILYMYDLMSKVLFSHIIIGCACVSVCVFVCVSRTFILGVIKKVRLHITHLTMN